MKDDKNLNNDNHDEMNQSPDHDEKANDASGTTEQPGAEEKKDTQDADWDKVKNIAGKLKEKSSVILEKATEYTKTSAKIVKEKAGKAADRAADLTKIGKLKFDISTLNRKIDDIYLQMGKELFRQFSETAGEGMTLEKFKPDMEKIQNFYKEIDDLRQKINELNEAHQKEDAE